MKKFFLVLLLQTMIVVGAFAKGTGIHLEGLVVGETAEFQVDLYNEGEGDLVFEFLAVQDFPQFKVLTDLPLTLSPGDTAQFKMSFVPYTHGWFEGRITFDNGYQIFVSAEVAAPTLNLEITSNPSFYQEVREEIRFEFTVENNPDVQIGVYYLNNFIVPERHEQGWKFSHIISEEDIKRGSVDLRILATDQYNYSIEETYSLSYRSKEDEITQKVSIKMGGAKSFGYLGEELSIEMEIENTGDNAIEKFSIREEHTGYNGAVGPIEPGKKVSHFIPYTVTQEDLGGYIVLRVTGTTENGFMFYNESGLEFKPVALVSAPELIDLGEVFYSNIDTLFNIEIHNPGTDTLKIRDIKTSSNFFSGDIAYYREVLIIPPGKTGGWPIRFKKRAVNMVFEGEAVLINNSINNSNLGVQLRAEVVYGPADWELKEFIQGNYSKVGEEIDIKIQAINLKDFIIGELRGCEKNHKRDFNFRYWINSFDSSEVIYKHIVTENDVLNSKIDFDFFTSDVTGNEVSLQKQVTLKIPEDDSRPRKIEPVIIREDNSPSAIQFNYSWEEDVLSLAFDLGINPGFEIDWNAVELPVAYQESHRIIVGGFGEPNSRVAGSQYNVKIVSKDGKPLPKGEGVLFEIPIEPDFAEKYEVNFNNIILLTATGEVLPFKAENYRLAVNDPITGVLSPVYPEYKSFNLLHHNYPNPFENSTTIKVNLPKAMQVRLAVYNITGEEIMVLVDGPLKGGEHEIHLDGTQLKAGVYLYQLQVDGLLFYKRMIKK